MPTTDTFRTPLGAVCLTEDDGSITRNELESSISNKEQEIPLNSLSPFSAVSNYYCICQMVGRFSLHSSKLQFVRLQTRVFIRENCCLDIGKLA